MDKLTRYREIIRRVIEGYTGGKSSNPLMESQLIEDVSHNHFELIRLGWVGPRRVHGTVIHVDIIGDKIWIQHDGTEWPVAEELVASGVPKEDIVLAYKPPDVRPLTGYAVG